MADSILKAIHSNFKYVFISCDINDNVKELNFQGSEENFQNNLACHFRRIIFDEKGKNELKETLKEKLENNENNKDKKNENLNSVSPYLINNAIENSQTYQIIPLTIPTETNGYYGVNCYIDDVGRIKKLPYNSRASRICNVGIYGDAFLSKTYDNEDFKRCDFTIKEYEDYLNNPPKSDNRWDQSQAMQDLLKQMNPKSNGDHVKEESIKINTCERCYKSENLKRCGKCKKIYYCSVECQKADFVFHKRICS